MDRRDYEPAQRENKPPAHHRKSRRRAWLAVAIVAVVAVAAAVAFFVLGGGPAGDDDLAKAACEEFIAEQLTVPSSAEFTHTSTKLAGGNWTVKGSVDAANTFGKMLHSEFRCVVDGDTWELVLLRIDE